MAISETFLDTTSHEGARDTAPGIEIETLRDRTAFRALRTEWDWLFSRAPGHPYADYAYMDAWLDSYGAGRRLAIRVARSKGRLVGVLPLSKGPGPGARSAVAQDRSGLVGPLLHPCLCAPEAVLAALLGCGYGQYTALEPVEADEAADLARIGAGIGLAVETRQVFNANAVDLTDGAEAWRASLSKNTRRALVRGAKALEGAGARWVTSANASQPEAAEAFLDAARTSWKSAAGSGFAGSPEGLAFIRALAERSDAGALYFSGLYQDDTPVAGCFGSIKGDTLYLNAVEFNETMANAGPGRFAMCRAIEAAAEQGLRRVDMMRSSALNQSVAKDTRPLFRVTLHRRGDPTVLLQRVAGLRRRLKHGALRGLSPRARHQVRAGGDHEA